MLSQEEIGEIVLESLEKAFYDLISLHDSEIKDMWLWQKLYKKALDNYENAVKLAAFYLYHHSDNDLIW